MSTASTPTTKLADRQYRPRLSLAQRRRTSVGDEGGNQTVPAQQQPFGVMGPRIKPASAAPVNVSVTLNFGNGDVRSGRFRWPLNITEEQAIAAVLGSLSDKELTEVSRVVFNQAPLNTQTRIAWLDRAPMGHYYFNQDLYGEGSVYSATAAQQGGGYIGNVGVTYTPEIPGVQPLGSIDGYTQERPQQQDPITLQYDPNTYNNTPIPPFLLQQHAMLHQKSAAAAHYPQQQQQHHQGFPQWPPR